MTEQQNNRAAPPPPDDTGGWISGTCAPRDERAEALEHFAANASIDELAALGERVLTQLDAAPWDSWDCVAYGPAGTQAGALCFFSPEPGQRECRSAGECTAMLAIERRRLFDRIREMAAEGDPTAAYLAEQFTDPEQLLGGAADIDPPAPAPSPVRGSGDPNPPVDQGSGDPNPPSDQRKHGGSGDPNPGQGEPDPPMGTLARNIADWEDALRTLAGQEPGQGEPDDDHLADETREDHR